MDKEQNLGKPPHFLAMSANEEFWDTSCHLVFLNRGCLRYSRKSFWEPLEREIIESPWEQRQNVLDALQYTSGVYEKTLSCLTEALNEIHDLNKSKRFWRIVIWPWLFGYIQILYERYMSLRAALKKYPDLITIGLADDSFITPTDTHEFREYVRDDPYNLQLYTKILLKLGIDIQRKNLKFSAVPIAEEENKYSPKYILQQAFNKLYRRVEQLFFDGRRIYLRYSYFPRSMELELFLKSFAKVWPIKETRKKMLPAILDRAKRVCIGNHLSEVEEFESIVKEMLPFDIPQCFVEGFAIINRRMKDVYPARPFAIFSAVGWYYDEEFRQWAAYNAEKGTLLIGTPHGGNYCSSKHHYIDDEIKVSDLYLTWGWETRGQNDKVIPAYGTKLCGRKMIGAHNSKQGILLVGTKSPRYTIFFPSLGYSFFDYLECQIRFLKALPVDIFSKTRVRLHRADHGWDMEQRIKESCPEVNIEKWDRTFLASLSNCRLYVCDHIATTLFEALALDKPTILFWDPEANPVKKEAEQYYESLRDVGVLHDSPEQAADAVVEAYSNVENWWSDPERRRVVQNFCHWSARTSSDASKHWNSFFNMISKDPLPRKISKFKNIFAP